MPLRCAALFALKCAVLPAPVHLWAQEDRPSHAFYSFGVGTHTVAPQIIHGFVVQASAGRWPKPNFRGFGIRIEAVVEQFVQRAYPPPTLETLALGGVTANCFAHRAAQDITGLWAPASIPSTGTPA